MEVLPTSRKNKGWVRALYFYGTPVFYRHCIYLYNYYGELIFYALIYFIFISVRSYDRLFKSWPTYEFLDYNYAFSHMGIDCRLVLADRSLQVIINSYLSYKNTN